MNACRFCQSAIGPAYRLCNQCRRGVPVELLENLDHPASMEQKELAAEACRQWLAQRKAEHRKGKKRGAGSMARQQERRDFERGFTSQVAPNEKES